MNDLDILTAALAYARRGWHVFPVRGKVPALDLVPRWSRDSSNDPAVITDWFAGSSGLGVALDLGKSGLCVIDGDRLELLTFRAKLDGWTYQGNRARMSWLYSMNGHPIPQSKHPWGEVKSAGGYVVLPPSPHPDFPGVLYQWVPVDPAGGPPPLLPFDVEELIAPEEEKPEPGPKWDGTKGDTLQREQALAKLDEQVKRLAEARENRNVALNTAALICGHYCPHYLSETEIVKALIDACTRNGLVRDDGMGPCLATLRSGLKAGMAEPEQLTKKPTLLDLDDMPSFEERIFGYSPTMQLIRTAARARLVSPWSTLGALLALILAEIPPHYAIPPLVGGGVGSLNFAVALTGPSGTAKSSAYKLARELLGLNGLRAKPIGPGTGEGLLMAFLYWDKTAQPPELVLKPVPQAVLFADEVGQIGKLSERSGASHAPLLRSALTGGDLFTTNADATRNRHVPDGRYRLAMVVGVQPSLAGVLLDDNEEGGPQRFLWVPSQDAEIPDTAPEWPMEPIIWKLPTNLRREQRDIFGRILIGFPSHVKEAAQVALRARHRSGMGSTDPESHGLLTRMKVAAACALLHGRLDVTEEDWTWSAVLMQLSLNVRRRCEEIVGTRVAKELVGKAIARRAADAGAAHREAEEDAKAIHRVVDKHAKGGAPTRHKGAAYGGCPTNCIKIGVPRLRGVPDRLAAAVDYAASAEWVEVDDTGKIRPGGSAPSV